MISALLWEITVITFPSKMPSVKWLSLPHSGERMQSYHYHIDDFHTCSLTPVHKLQHTFACLRPHKCEDSNNRVGKKWNKPANEAEQPHLKHMLISWWYGWSRTPPESLIHLSTPLLPPAPAFVSPFPSIKFTSQVLCWQDLRVLLPRRFWFNICHA